jgi:hypothetical protein
MGRHDRSRSATTTDQKAMKESFPVMAFLCPVSLGSVGAGVVFEVAPVAGAAAPVAGVSRVEDLVALFGALSKSFSFSVCGVWGAMRGANDDEKERR